MNSELKPCPFCGGEAKLMLDKCSGVYFIGCSNDKCLGFGAIGWSYETAEEAIKAWNTRAERTCKGCVIPERDYGHAPRPCMFCLRNNDRRDMYEPKEVAE